MANFFRGGLLNIKWQSSLQLFRGSRRVNVQRPRAPHYERARVLALLRPQFEISEKNQIYMPPSLTCKKMEEIQRYKNRPENPLEKILAREMVEEFERSHLIAILHKNPISGYEEFEANIKFNRENMKQKVYSKYTAKLALQGTCYEKVLDLFVCHNVLVFCDEPKVAKLLKVLKKIPQYILMAAIVEGKLLSITQLKSYSQIKDITEARARFVATLNLAGTQLLSKLTQPQTTIVSQLTELAKIKEEKKNLP